MASALTGSAFSVPSMSLRMIASLEKTSLTMKDPSYLYANLSRESDAMCRTFRRTRSLGLNSRWRTLALNARIELFVPLLRPLCFLKLGLGENPHGGNLYFDWEDYFHAVCTDPMWTLVGARMRAFGSRGLGVSTFPGCVMDTRENESPLTILRPEGRWPNRKV
ncbi:hypothetical protein CRG98_010263 [Punica granatum]|uniref:Uncharacterized protein n=1 Tax=Punica granatum TaxID=22663 RepID=A0A2I0KLJ8_PUNGR|nr:hypothetical protein CRG98_010263 [Punica granatum]